MAAAPGRPSRVVIVGGGFGGLSAAQALKDAPVEVVLLDRRNFHLFQPLLYQVATGGLSPANIAAPLRSILRKQRNARVLLAEVTGFDLAGRRVLWEGGETEYDALIVAIGSRHHYFGHEDWESIAPGLKTIEDALEIRRRLFLAFERAESLSGETARAWLTFLLVGGGPTGVELAGAVAEIARATLTHDFRSIRPADARIILVEALDRVLPTFPQSLSDKAASSLQRLGVEVRTATTVEAIDEDGATLRHGDETQRVEARTVLWTAGNKVTFPAEGLGSNRGAESDRVGRLFVGPDLSLPGHPEVFVIGDGAHVEQDGRPLPAVAPVAQQQGRYAADCIRARLAGDECPPFRYRGRGSLATIGRSAAVADLGRVRLSGFIGWVAWLTVHLLNLARYENRVLVLVQWAWNYFTGGRSARLITGATSRAGKRTRA